MLLYSLAETNESLFGTNSDKMRQNSSQNCGQDVQYYDLEILKLSPISEI
jgi:hypothetical protein